MLTVACIVVVVNVVLQALIRKREEDLGKMTLTDPAIQEDASLMHLEGNPLSKVILIDQETQTFHLLNCHLLS